MNTILDIVGVIFDKIKRLRLSEKFDALDKRKKILVIFLGMVIAFSMYYRLFFLPQISSMRKIKSDLVSLNAKISQVRSSIPDISLTQNELNQAKSEFEDLKVKLQLTEENLPGAESIPSLLGEFVRQGSGLQIDFVSVKPSSAKDDEQYSRLNIEIKVDAAYNDFVNYLHRIENISKFITPVSVNVEETKSDRRGITRGTIVLSTLLGTSRTQDAGLKKTSSSVEDFKLGKSPFTSQAPDQVDKRFTLSGINWTGPQKVALINNDAYREGDKIQDMVIKKILPNMVIMYDKTLNEDYALTLNIERSKNEQ